MTKRYLIKLYPTGTFFFGGETTFGSGFRRNYLAHSEDFPQQTTLLGMLRYQLLAQNEQIPITDRGKATTLIGAASFQIDGTDSFGLVKALSPVFLMNGEVSYRLNPMDDKYFQDKETKTLQHQSLVPTTKPGKSYLGGRTLDGKPKIVDRISGLSRFDHKAHYQDRFMAADGSRTYEKSDVLCTIQQVGIQKGKDGRTLNNAFFKQTLLRFPSLDWAFAFYSDLDTDEFQKEYPGQEINFQDAFVTLGGEQSLFKMDVQEEKIADNSTVTGAFCSLFAIKPKPQEEHNRIELLSDAYVPVEKNLYEQCQLTYTDTVSFRGIKSTVDTNQNYHNRPTKTARFELLRRGSVLWSNKPAETTAALRNPAFETIGYNAFYNGPLLTTPLTQPNA